MTGTRLAAVVLGLACGALGGAAWVAAGGGAIDVDVQVSPQTIVLGLDKGAAVTVHTDIAYGAVAGDSVALSGVPAYTTFADNRGNLVAKFRQAEIEAIIAPPAATLVLTGVTHEGMSFAGSDRVRVIADPSAD